MKQAAGFAHRNVYSVLNEVYHKKVVVLASYHIWSKLKAAVYPLGSRRKEP